MVCRVQFSSDTQAEGSLIQKIEWRVCDHPDQICFLEHREKRGVPEPGVECHRQGKPAAGVVLLFDSEKRFEIPEDEFAGFRITHRNIGV